MMYFRLLQHHLYRLFRSFTSGRKLVERLLVAFVSVYVGIGLLALGIVLPDLVAEQGDADPARLVHQYTLYGALALLGARLLSQKMPSGRVRPYTTLPLDRRVLVRFIHADAATSVFTVLPFVFLAPFAVRMGTAELIARPWIWFGGLTLVVATTHFLHIAIRLHAERLWNTGLLILGGAGLVLVADVWSGVRVMAPVSEALFGALARGSVFAFLGCLAAAGASAALATRSFHDRIRASADAPASAPAQQSTGLANSFQSLLRRFPAFLVPPAIIPLVLVDVQMAQRAKRARQTLLFGLGFGVYCVLYLWMTELEPSFLQSVTQTIFVISAIAMPTFSHAANSIAWSGAYFDRLLTTSAEQHLIHAKLRVAQMLTVTSIILFVPPICLLIPNGVPTALGAALFGLGFLTPCTLLTSTLGREPINLNESQMSNFQGMNVWLFIAGVAVTLLVVPFLFVPSPWDSILMAVIGVVGLLADSLWIRGITTAFYKQRPSIVEGFRAGD